MSFPIIRGLINHRHFRNTTDAYPICNWMTGAPVKPQARWTMINQSSLNPSNTKRRSLKDVKEKEKT